MVFALQFWTILAGTKIGVRGGGGTSFQEKLGAMRLRMWSQERVREYDFLLSGTNFPTVGGRSITGGSYPYINVHRPREQLISREISNDTYI
jgi:hypothetical protein